MNASGWLQLGVYVVVLLLLVKPLGAYMAAVYEGRAAWAQRIGGPLERLALRLWAGVNPPDLLVCCGEDVRRMFAPLIPAPIGSPLGTSPTESGSVPV